MTFATKTTDARLTLVGRFDAHEAVEFRSQLDQLMDDCSTDVRIDLDEVTFVDSAALAELVRGMKRARSEGRELVLESPSDPVRVILELTRLDAAFTIAE